jgi:hypothetical protein
MTTDTSPTSLIATDEVGLVARVFRGIRYSLCLLILVAFLVRSGPRQLPLWTLIFASAIVTVYFKQVWQAMIGIFGIGIACCFLRTNGVAIPLEGSLKQWIVTGVVMVLTPALLGWTPKGTPNRAGRVIAWIFAAVAGTSIQFYFGAREARQWLEEHADDPLARDASAPPTDRAVLIIIVSLIAAAIAYYFPRIRNLLGSKR